MTSHTLIVYREGGTWRLDDRPRGLVEEPLLFGMGKMLDRFTANIPRAAGGCRLHLADAEFPGAQAHLEREEADAGGYWYRAPAYELRGWLGNNGLTRYFAEPPARLFVKGEALPPDEPGPRGRA